MELDAGTTINFAIKKLEATHINLKTYTYKTMHPLEFVSKNTM